MSSPPTPSPATGDLQPARPARRPARRHRRAAAAALEPQQPGRLRRRRDARHDSRRDAARSPNTPTIARRRLPRHRHPVEPGADDARRAASIPTTASTASSSYHERQDARFAEAAAELSARDGQADPHRHRAGGRRSRQRRTGDGAGDRPALLPERQPGRHRARPPLPRRPSPAATARSPLVSRRRGAVSPLVVLAAVIAARRRSPCSASGAVADGRDDDETVESLPPTTVAGAGAAPAPVLDTPLLSFRRVPGLIARDLNDDAFAAAVDGFAGTLDPTSCVVVATRRRRGRRPQPGPAGDPGEQPEAARRRGRPRRARRRPRVHHRRPRRRRGRAAWSPATSTSSAAATHC